MSADGTNEQQITNSHAQERYPDWSPDGQSLVFFSDETGKQQIYVVTKRNGKWENPRILAAREVNSAHPRWSPVGGTIAFLNSKGILRVSPNGENLKMLLPRRNGYRYRYLAWSRDGKTLYFREMDNQYRKDIWSVPAAGGRPKLLVHFEYWNRDEFTADDKDFFFTVSDRESDIWGLSLKR